MVDVFLLHSAYVELIKGYNSYMESPSVIGRIIFNILEYHEQIGENKLILIIFYDC